MMKRVLLRGTDLEVSRVCLGTWQFNDGDGTSSMSTWPSQDRQMSKKIVDAAIEEGINFFDTAEGYKNSETVLGEALAGRRKNVVIASKMGATKPPDDSKYTAADIDQHLTNTLRKLQTDYLDLYQVHWPVFMADMGETVAELKRQQSVGRIRYYGVCNFGPTNLAEFCKAGGQPVTAQMPYNLLWRCIEYEIVGECVARNLSILPYSPLQQGLLSGKFAKASDVPEGRRRTKHFNKDSTTLSRHGKDGAEGPTFEAIAAIRDVCSESKVDMSEAALAWVLNRPNVASVIVGASKPEQVKRNTKLNSIPKDLDEKLTDCTDNLKKVFGADADMWASSGRIK